MFLKSDKKTEIFAELSNILDDYINGRNKNTATAKYLDNKITEAYTSNPWFCKQNILDALSGISYMTQNKKLSDWMKSYDDKKINYAIPKKIAVIMAGNLPLVSFHDFLCVLMSGHSFVGKLSSNDQILPFAIAKLLTDIEPELAKKINFTTEILNDFDAIIATGSDNSARYFEYYFSKYPHIIRKNRSSLAILDGNEDKKALHALSEDIFKYYGMGCRNISKLFVPDNYSFEEFFDAMESWGNIIEFYKYNNNYDYYKAMFLVNKTKHFDNGFMLLKEDKGLSSPLSVVYYQKYKTDKDITDYIAENKNSIQCIVATNSKTNIVKKTIPFGKSQFPELWDYADGIDTMKFLINLS